MGTHGYPLGILQISLLKQNTQWWDAYRLKASLFLHLFLLTTLSHWKRFSRYWRFSDKSSIEMFWNFSNFSWIATITPGMLNYLDMIGFFENQIDIYWVNLLSLNATSSFLRSFFQKLYKNSSSTRLGGSFWDILDLFLILILE